MMIQEGHGYAYDGGTKKSLLLKLILFSYCFIILFSIFV